MPGAQSILEMVARERIPHAVVTNSTRKEVVAIRNTIPALHALPLWITREDYPCAKPSPDGYIRAIRELGSSEHMIGFEDTLRGVRALQGAAITPVLICCDAHPQLQEIKKEPIWHAPSFTAFCTRMDTKASQRLT